MDGEFEDEPEIVDFDVHLFYLFSIDLNDDGIDDLVSNSESEGIHVHYNRGDGNYASRLVTEGFYEIRTIRFDSDELPDLLLLNGEEKRVFVNTGQEGFREDFISTGQEKPCCE